MIIALKFFRLNLFNSIFNAISNVEKNFGSKFWAWVSVHTTTLKS